MSLNSLSASSIVIATIGQLQGNMHCPIQLYTTIQLSFSFLLRRVFEMSVFRQVSQFLFRSVHQLIVPSVKID